MREILAAVAIGLVLSILPAGAEAPLSAQQLQTVERFVGPPVDEAMRLCLSNGAPDLTKFETDWVAAGWPAFESHGTSRISQIPPGERQLMTLAISSGPVSDTPLSGSILTCVILVPTPFQPAMDQHLTARFGSTAGAFYLEGEDLVRIDLSAQQPQDLSQLLQSASQRQQVVILHSEQERGTSVARISVLRRAD